MNILYFAETGLGVGSMCCEQVSAIYKQNKSTIAVVSGLEQQTGLILGLQNQGIKVIPMTGMEYHLNFKEHVLLLRKNVIANNIDIVHVQTNWQLVMSFLALLGIKNRPKIVYTIHSFRNHKGWLEQNITRLLMTIILFLFSDIVFAPSRFLKQKFSIISSKIFILPLGIDQMYIDRAYVETDDNIRMIFPARFRDGKRQEMIIRALARYIIETGDYSIKLILPGDGEHLEDCIVLSEHLGIKNNVEFPGLCSKVQLLELYDKSNVLVCSSVSETYCQSIIEGFCLGKYVISTSVGVASEILDNKTSGFLFSTEEELILHLKNLFYDRVDYKSIGVSNYHKRFTYSWDNITAKYLNLLSRI